MLGSPFGEIHYCNVFNDNDDDDNDDDDDDEEEEEEEEDDYNGHLHIYFLIDLIHSH